MPPLPLPADLEHEGITLRSLRARDAPAFAAAFTDDPLLAETIGVPAPSPRSALRMIARLSRDRARGEALELAVSDASRAPFHGCVLLHSVAWEHRRAELGYWLVREARGRGIGARAAGLLSDWALGPGGFERLEITTTPDNAAALALAARLGFTREGLLRARDVEAGRRLDIVVLGRLRSDGDPARIN